MNKLYQRLLEFQLLIANATWQVSGVNFSRLSELSKHIRTHEDIRSVVVFSQQSFVQKLNGFETFLQSQSSEVPVVLIDDVYVGDVPLDFFLGSWAMAFVFMDEIDNLGMMAVVNITLLHIHSSKIVFLLERAPRDTEVVIRFFQTCLRLGIVNVVIMFHDEVIGYSPFPTVVLDNLTTVQINEYFPDRVYDLKGYTFYSPIQLDGARVYIYNDKDGVSRLTGVNVEIFRSFVQRHNATFERLISETNQSSFDIMFGMSLVQKGEVDILMHSFSYVNPKLFGWSYPIAQVKWLVAAPYVGEISTYMYLVLPFGGKVWILLFVTFVYICIAGYIVSRTCQRFSEYGQIFSQSLMLFLYLPSKPSQCTLQAVIFDMQILCYSLILTNIYLAFLSAFLTTTVQGHQIDSFEELYQSGIQIITPPFESNLIRNTAGFLPKYERVFHYAEYDTVNDYRKSLNKSYALVMAEDRANFFLGQQKLLEKKRMHVCKRTLGTYLLSFTMRMDSPFQKNFDAILLQLYQTGLYKKWETDVFDVAVATKYLQLYRSESEDSVRPLSSSHLLVCWITYAVGIVLSFVVIFVEITRFRFRKK